MNTMTQNIQDAINNDPYLESTKKFHLEMPLYHSFLVSEIGADSKIYNLFKSNEKIDAYCIWCDKDSVFYVTEHHNFQYDHWKIQTEYFSRHVYACARNNCHKYFTYYLKSSDKLTKIGQYPSVADFQIPQSVKYRKILGEEQYRELTKGIGLSAHGVGIGAFVYLRRVFENLIEKAHIQAQEENSNFDNEEFGKSRMDEKINILKNHLPNFLVENRGIYAILSKGIHELAEDECQNYFESMKIGIEQILDEKIIQKEKADKADKARKAIQGIQTKLASQDKKT